MFRLLFRFITKSPLLILIIIVAWLFLHFSYNTYQNVVIAVQERDQLMQSNAQLIINKQKLTLLRNYLESDMFVYEEALNLGYSFENEQVIDVDYKKIENDSRTRSNWWRDIFKN